MNNQSRPQFIQTDRNPPSFYSNQNQHSALHSPIHPRNSQLYSRDSYYQTPNPNLHNQNQNQYMNNHRHSNGHMSAQPYTPSNSNLASTVDQTSPIQEKRAKRKKYCFCFSKNGCIIFACSMLALVAVLAVVGFFLWPRIPQATYENVSLVNNNGELSAPGSLSAQDLLQSTKVQSSGVITIPLVIQLRVTNPNYIRWTFNNVTVDGTINIENNQQFSVGNGTIFKPFSMPSKSVDNKLLIYYNFVLDSRASNFIQAANLVQTSCTVGGPPFRFNYKAKIFINAIKWLGIKPTISDTINFNCPTSELSTLGINVADLIALLTRKQK